MIEISRERLEQIVKEEWVKKKPMLINMMKCPKHGWFHGGSTGWICPQCKKVQSSEQSTMEEET